MVEGPWYKFLVSLIFLEELKLEYNLDQNNLQIKNFAQYIIF